MWAMIEVMPNRAISFIGKRETKSRRSMRGPPTPRKPTGPPYWTFSASMR